MLRRGPDDAVLTIGDAVCVTFPHRVLLALALVALTVGLLAGGTIAWAPLAAILVVWAIWAGADRLIRDVTAHTVQRPPAR